LCPAGLRTLAAPTKASTLASVRATALGPSNKAQPVRVANQTGSYTTDKRSNMMCMTTEVELVIALSTMIFQIKREAISWCGLEWRQYIELQRPPTASFQGTSAVSAWAKQVHVYLQRFVHALLNMLFPHGSYPLVCSLMISFLPLETGFCSSTSNFVSLRRVNLYEMISHRPASCWLFLFFLFFPEKNKEKRREREGRMTGRPRR
jgi:hypothetical protein